MVGRYIQSFVIRRQCPAFKVHYEDIDNSISAVQVNLSIGFSGRCRAKTNLAAQWYILGSSIYRAPIALMYHEVVFLNAYSLSRTSNTNESTVNTPKNITIEPYTEER